MKNIVCKSNVVTLRKTEEWDLGFVINAEREPDNAKYVGQWSKEQHISALENKDVLHLMIKDSSTAKSVGYVIMAGLQNSSHNIEFRRIVVCNKGNGIGRETLRLIKKVAFEELGAHRLWLDVRSKNLRAQNLYKSEGFKEEGLLRECILYNGSYESVIVMSVLENE